VTDREIIDQHHRLFDLCGDVSKSAMNWGFQCGPGWFDLLNRLCTRLQTIAPGGFAITSIKSKFSTLRLSYRGGNQEVEAEIERAKAEALVTPE
jgi:hypothetical protein